MPPAAAASQHGTYDEPSRTGGRQVLPARGGLLLQLLLLLLLEIVLAGAQQQQSGQGRPLFGLMTPEEQWMVANESMAFLVPTGALYNLTGAASRIKQPVAKTIHRQTSTPGCSNTQRSVQTAGSAA